RGASAERATLRRRLAGVAAGRSVWRFRCFGRRGRRLRSARGGSERLGRLGFGRLRAFGSLRVGGRGLGGGDLGWGWGRLGASVRRLRRRGLGLWLGGFGRSLRPLAALGLLRRFGGAGLGGLGRALG